MQTTCLTRVDYQHVLQDLKQSAILHHPVLWSQEDGYSQNKECVLNGKFADSITCDTIEFRYAKADLWHTSATVVWHCVSAESCWAEARVKIARMTLTIKLDGNWSSFQLANSAPPLSVTDIAIAPSTRM